MKPPLRYNFVSKPRPWYWVFTFWLCRWKNYGELVNVPADDPGYGTAIYELGYLYPNPPEVVAKVLAGANKDLRCKPTLEAKPKTSFR